MYIYTCIPYRKVTYEAITRVCQTTYEAILPVAAPEIFIWGLF